jgi:hypothetical protein
MKLYRILIGLLPLTLTAACGGSDDDDEGSSVPLEDVPAAYAGAICEAYTRCLGPLFDVFLSGEDCTQNFTIRVEEELPSFQQALDDGRMTYHGDQLAACTADIRSRDCSELQQRGTGPCEAIFVGTVALGESCSLDEECTGSAFCDFGATCPGTCRELAAEGDGCNEDDDCQSGLVCSDAEQSCETPAGAGDLCQAGNPDCEIGYLCAGANADMNQPGNCRAYDEVFSAGSGDTCDPTNGVLCTSDLTCQIEVVANPLEWSCAPKVGSGDTCRPAFPDQCPADEYCNVNAAAVALGMLDGTCEPRPGPGEPCGGFDSTVCAANTRCNGGTCKELTHIGGGCMVDDVCYSDHCADGQCASANSCE